MSGIDFLLIAFGILDFFLSLAVLIRNKRNEENTAFAIFSFFLGIWTISIAVFRISTDPVFTFIFAKSIYISGSFIASTLLYFTYTFHAKKKLSLKTKLFIVVPSLVHFFLILIPDYLTRDIVRTEWGKEVILGKPEYFIFSSYFIIFFYSALYLLWKKYRESSGRVKNQVYFIFVSILFAGIISSVFDLFLPWFGNYRHIYVGPLTSGIVFWFVVYAIVRYKLWDFKLVVVRSFVYTLLIIWFTGIYTLAIFLISDYIFQGVVSTSQAVIYALLAIFVAVTLPPLKKLLEKNTDKIFFRNKYSSNELLSQLTKIMAVTVSVEFLIKNTLSILSTKMRITRYEFFLYQNEKLVPYLAEESNPSSREFVQRFIQHKKIIVFEDLDDGDLKEILRELNMSVFLPLYSSNKLHGILFFGEKKSGDQYSSQDLEVLEIFGPQLAVALENALSYEEIKRFNITLKDKVDHATRDLKQANEKLKEVDKLKTEFVSLASHELRTPMTAIKSYLWMALKGKGGKLNEKQIYYLDRAYRSTDRLIKLVNDMLNISRIEAGRISLEMQSVDLVKITREVVEEVLPRAREVGLQIEINSPSSLVHVLADPDKIKEVLINLIGNSLKFTPRGGKINVSFSPGDMISVKVSDNGVGILEEDIPKLFQKFGLVQGSYTVNKNATQGTGLGLYICKSIIQMHGGEILARSDGLNKGSVFVFTLNKYSEKLYKKYRAQDKLKSINSVPLEHTQV